MTPYRLLLALSAVLLFAPAAVAQPVGQVDGIVAVVGSNVILRSDVEALALQLSRGGAVTDVVRRQALDDLITQEVLVEHAKRDTTIIVTPDEVNETLDQRTEALIAQVGGEDQVIQLYGKSVAQLREDFRKQVQNQLLAQTLQRRKYFQVRITPQEVREWFAAIPADSIPEVPNLVRVANVVQFPDVDQSARDEARATIDAIRDSIATGAETIEALAQRYSDDPGSATRGGRYASVNIRDLVPEFGAIAATLNPDELSQVFETQFGYHVMRLNNRVGDVVDFNHVLIRIDASRTDPTEALATLEMVRDSVLTGGASFALMAKEFSEDETSAARGGNVTVPQSGDRDLRYDALSPTWKQTLDTLEVGEISQPANVELLDGREAYQIVLLQRRTPAHPMTLADDYALIEEFALQDKRQQVMSEWIDELRRSVYVAIKDESLRSPDIAG
ncbi:MAG: peptidylprolyl isomerase [Rhodothermales bacterium]